MLDQLEKPTDTRTLAAIIDEAGGQPGWARALPEDPETLYCGESPWAHRLQAEIAQIGECGGWGVSHLCLMHILGRFPAALPARA